MRSSLRDDELATRKFVGESAGANALAAMIFAFIVAASLSLIVWSTVDRRLDRLERVSPTTVVVR